MAYQLWGYCSRLHFARTEHLRRSTDGRKGFVFGDCPDGRESMAGAESRQHNMPTADGKQEQESDLTSGKGGGAVLNSLKSILSSTPPPTWLHIQSCHQQEPSLQNK